MPDDIRQAGEEGSRPAPLPPGALCLALSVPLVDANILFGWGWAALLAAPLVALYFALCWPRVSLNGKLLLLLSLGVGVATLFAKDGASTLTYAAARLAFFPTFIAMLGLLRAAADASHTPAAAGALLVRQPPSRRYAALSLGGHIFGILLNIGGLALLLDMTRRANTLEAGFGDPRVVALRERRMTLAVMRGFACIALWSPLGLALNLLLACVPDLSWIEVAPYGLLAALGFMALGFVFDRLEFPAPTRPHVPGDNRTGRRALLKMVGHIAALSVLALAAEFATRLPFQAILINLVPLYALGWLLANGFVRDAPNPLAFAGQKLRDGGLRRWPDHANEIAVFAASGFLGVILAALAPREALQLAVSSLALPPGLFAAMLAAAVFVLGFVGVNPMISASILAATLSSVTIPGLSHANMVLALAGGWTCVIGVAPLMSSLVLTAGIIGRRAAEVGLVWNGRYALAGVVLWLLALLVVRV